MALGAALCHSYNSQLGFVLDRAPAVMHYTLGQERADWDMADDTAVVEVVVEGRNLEGNPWAIHLVELVLWDCKGAVVVVASIVEDCSSGIRADWKAARTVDLDMGIGPVEVQQNTLG